MSSELHPAPLPRELCAWRNWKQSVSRAAAVRVASDILIAISGSGNSPNILRAVEWANDHDMTTWGVTGFDGGQLQEMAGHNLHVPSTDMGLVESVHLVAFHWVLDDVYARINQVGRYKSSGIRRAA